MKLVLLSYLGNRDRLTRFQRIYSTRVTLFLDFHSRLTVFALLRGIGIVLISTVEEFRNKGITFARDIGV